MKNKAKMLIVAAVLICAAVAAVIYTRPLTIEQRYPAVSLSQCTQIRGWYSEGTAPERTEFAIEPDDPDFDKLVEIFRSAAFKSRLPAHLSHALKTHRVSDDDFEWEMLFGFDGVDIQNGGVVGGDVLSVEDFYGDMELFFDSDQVRVTLSDKEQWRESVLSVIKRHPVG